MPVHSTASELEHYVHGRLSADDSSVVQTHLQQCQDCQLLLADIAFQTQWKGPERRSEPRIPVNFTGRLKLLDPLTSVGPPHDVRVIEISRNGLKIHTPRFLIQKTLVQIHFNGKSVLGQVKYCTKAEGGGYLAGLQQRKDFDSV
jgi:hypothetical protein